MIKVSQERDNGGPCPTITRDHSVADAFERLSVFEVGFGGHIVELTEDRVVVHTRVLMCFDVTTFTGTPEEMRPLVHFAAAALTLLEHKRDAFVNGVVKDLKTLSCGGKPFIVATFGATLFGGRLAKGALMLMMEVSDKETVDRMSQLDLKDMSALTLMVVETKTPIAEAIDIFLN
jgi:hypothetical protein